MIISYSILLPIEKAQAVELVAKITNASIDVFIVVVVLQFFNLFLDLLFLSLKY